MLQSSLRIRAGSIEEAVRLSTQLPEFENPVGVEVYRSRLEDRKHIILIAELDQPCGFKVGYDRDSDGSFYSWMGGVLPDFRRDGIAKALAQAMEAFCRENNYHVLRMKTRNEHRAMLLFAIRNDFRVVGFKAYPDPMKSRILLEKQL